jgi:2-haloacid dehalogenase
VTTLLLFDLNGTLTDPSALGAPWSAPELGADVLAGAVRNAMVDTILGRYRDFREHVEATLRVNVAHQGLGLDESRVAQAMEIAAALPAFPDTAPALETMVAAGHRLAVLTNSGADAGRRTLEAAGLADRFAWILGVDAVHAFKPHPATYAHAIEQLDAPPAEVTFVSAHPWDLAGAANAGMRTALVRRGEGAATVFPRPELEAPDLTGIAAALV